MNTEPDQTEPDDRFPSGEWIGFFLQPRLFAGRVQMSLVLTFKDGQVTGGGTDRVDNFTLNGRYEVESGQVTLRKKYMHRTSVEYRGFAEPQHKGIWGIWELPLYDRGGWHIWPKAHGLEVDITEREVVEAPTTNQPVIVVD